MLWSFLHSTLVKIAVHMETQHNVYAFLLLISICITSVPMSIQRAHIWTKQGTENLSPPLFTERSDSISIQYNLDIRIFKIATRNFGCAHDRASQHSWGPGFKSQQNQNESPYTKPPNPTDYSSVCLRVLRTPSQNWNSQIKSLSIRLVLKGPSSGVVPFLQGLFMERWDGVNIWMMRQLSSKMLLSPPPPVEIKQLFSFFLFTLMDHSSGLPIFRTGLRCELGLDSPVFRSFI